jgi:hypothetical protein
MNGGPAFPVQGVLGPDEDRPNRTNWWTDGNEGMSLRDYFAAKAMQGIVSRYPISGLNESDMERIAELAYYAAYAMLKESVS